MSTDGVSTDPSTQQAIDQRLDAIDRSLLGVLPRSERLEIVAKLEARFRELLATDANTETALQANVPEGGSNSTAARPTAKRRSRAAVMAGISGIASLLLLFVVFPLVYVVVAFLASELNSGGVVLAVLLGSAPVAALVAGCLAVVLGIVGLVKIARRNGTLVGRGWAITGLCTGPFPALVAGVPVLLVIVQLLLSGGAISVASVQTVSSPPCNSCGSSPVFAAAPTYGPAAVSPLAPVSFSAPHGSPATVPSSPYPPSISPTGYLSPSPSQPPALTPSAIPSAGPLPAMPADTPAQEASPSEAPSASKETEAEPDTSEAEPKATEACE